MRRYRVVVSGTGIFVESGDQGDSFSAFVACRFVQAETEELAIATAKRDLLMEWNRCYNRSRTAGLPRLTVELVARVHSPFKSSRKSDGYRFFALADELEEILSIIIKQSSGWF